MDSMSNWSPDWGVLAEEKRDAGIHGFRKPSPIDIADILPSDPFEMARDSATEEITASVEGFNGEFHSNLVMDSKWGDFEGNRGGDELLPGLNLLCRGRVRLFPEPHGFSIDKLSGAEEIASAQRDVADSLPSDPFGMDVSTLWGITGSLEGLEDIDWSFDCVNNNRESDGLVFGLNLVCRGRVRLMPDVGNDESDSKHNNSAFSFERVIVANDMEEEEEEGEEGDFEADSDVQCCSEILEESHGFEPHYAMFLALRYLGVKDLLSVEMVCRSLKNAVRSDPSMWMNVNIDHPLNAKLTDDALIKITSRACGLLKSLTMVGCFRVTNAAIKHVVDNNPGLLKMSVPGCFRLSIEEMLLTFKSAQTLSLKQLRIGGLSGVTSEQYEQLKILLQADAQLQSRSHKPVYYHDGNSYNAVDDRPLDIEKCPRCNEVRLVYDCPSESCQKSDLINPCKACFLCVSRCINCGCCLTNRDYVETFALDAICLDCIFNCQDEDEQRGGGTGRQEGVSIFNQPIFCQATSYLCFYA